MEFSIYSLLSYLIEETNQRGTQADSRVSTVVMMKLKSNPCKD